MTISSLLLSIALVAAQLDPTQHAALMEFYNASGCNAIDCPRFAVSEACAGNFLVCSGTNVTQLFISNRALTGTISSAVGRLTALKNLQLDTNMLVGTIPSAVGQLTALQILLLHNNARLGGTIPSTFSQLLTLANIGLSFTQLSGAFPPTSATLTTCSFERTFLDCSSTPSACPCSARLLGDDCENRLSISDGAASMSTAGATTCLGCGSCAIQNDVWREWTASCTGSAKISTCGSAANTMLGVFRGVCPGASTPTAATESGSADCDDFGSCGGSSHEEATLAVVSGERIIIRLGSVFGVLDIQNFSISCTAMATAVTTTAVATGPTMQALSTSVGATTSAAPTLTAASTIVTTMGAPTNTSTTAAISATAPAATPPGGTDVALIAGVVGGVAALLLLVAIVAVVVWRRRRATAAPDGTAMSPPATSQYASTFGVSRPDDAPHYDRLTPKEAAAMNYEATDAEFKL